MSEIPIWTPSSERIASARLTAFREELISRGLAPASIASAQQLQQWSVKHSDTFWREVWRAADVMADAERHVEVASDPAQRAVPWQSVVVGVDRMAPPEVGLGPDWFTGARINFAEHLLRRRDDHNAIVAWNERGPAKCITYAELAMQVAQTAAALRAIGVGVGDRVAGYLPNIPEAVVVMLAASSIGAIWSSCSPDFGVRGVLDRFSQIEPKVLIVADGYQYAGKQIDCLARVREVADAIPSLRAVWVVANVGAVSDLGDIAIASHFDAVLRAHGDRTEPAFVRLPFNHPLYVLYSSGTTGLPKCMVHGAGGTLLQHWKELALHTDVRAGDVVFYFTTCGWMMWNWLVSALALGATVVLYDGAPLAPDPSMLWRMADAERVTVFGTSAKYLAVLEKEGFDPREQFELGALRTILSTGSPLAPHSYDFVYRAIKADVHLASISGGTDIVSCFALGDPTGPVYRGALQMRGLGMAVDVYDPEGRSIRGRPGELVCTKPFPSMPVAFWNDTGGAKYQAAYFDHFADVWRHGDWAELTANDGLIIHGRSDATLNPGGVRIGTAELYRQVEQIPEILESVVVEQTVGTGADVDTRIVLFVRMRDGVVLNEELRTVIKARIREFTSPHHVPKRIVAVRDIPRTISGKITELAVREAIHGRPVHNVDALANPEALALFRDIPELST